jgi:uncharacterized protein YqgV (UPF0045/DUF77 family)
MKSALAIQCLPLGAAGKSKEEVYTTVDAAIAAIAESGLDYTVGPFETVIEGPADKLFDIARRAHQAIIDAGSPSVASYIKIFSSPDLGSSDEKTAKYRAKGH